MGNVCRGFEFPGGSEVKNLPEMVGKISWSRKCQPTPVFLPGESQGQRSLAGYSPWGDRELDTTELPSTTQHNPALVFFVSVSILFYMAQTLKNLPAIWETQV